MDILAQNLMEALLKSVIYCDESCHLENDESSVMGLGAIKCPKDKLKSAKDSLKAIKRNHKNLSEIKWTKVSASRSDMYNEIVDWFYKSNFLSFRAVIVPDKSIIDNEKYNNGDHDDFYYKMYFLLLRRLVNRQQQHEIYLDIKDTNGAEKLRRLKDVLCNNNYDFSQRGISNIQHVRSHEIELMQICDLFLGATVYRNRGITTSAGKLRIVNCIEKLRGSKLNVTSSYNDQKFDILVWEPKNG